jgi:RNA polymerase sigma factor (sigma-70 family)
MGRGSGGSRGDARRKRVETHWHLIHDVAAEFAGRGLPLAELLQEASVAFLTAADRFAAKRHGWFGAYAARRIRRRLRFALRSHRVSVGLIAPADDAVEQLADDGSVDPHSDAVSSEAQQDLDSLLLELDPPSASVLRLRFGIGMAAPLTRDEIARKLGFNVQRVLFLEERALSMLKRKRRFLRRLANR